MNLTYKRNINLYLFFLLSLTSNAQNVFDLNNFKEKKIISTIEFKTESEPNDKNGITTSISKSTTEGLRIKEFIISGSKQDSSFIIATQTQKMKLKMNNGFSETIYDSDDTFERDPKIAIMGMEYDPLINKVSKIKTNTNASSIDTLNYVKQLPLTQLYVLTKKNDLSIIFFDLPKNMTISVGNSWSDTLQSSTSFIINQYKIIKITGDDVAVIIKGISKPKDTPAREGKNTNDAFMKEIETNYEGQIKFHVKTFFIKEIELKSQSERSLALMGKSVFLSVNTFITAKNAIK